MNSPHANKLTEIVEQLRRDFPDVSLVSEDSFRWDPRSQTIYYAADKPRPDWSLLHEAGHMLEGHEHYQNDVDLLIKEVDAWEAAKQLGKKYKVVIDQEHIEDCLDSYRDWLHKRSTCPTCWLSGLEKEPGCYICINCRKQWRVSGKRFCRVYRQSKTPA